MVSLGPSPWCGPSGHRGRLVWKCHMPRVPVWQGRRALLSQAILVPRMGRTLPALDMPHILENCPNVGAQEAGASLGQVQGGGSGRRRRGSRAHRLLSCPCLARLVRLCNPGPWSSTQQWPHGCCPPGPGLVAQAPSAALSGPGDRCSRVGAAWRQCRTCTLKPGAPAWW